MTLLGFGKALVGYKADLEKAELERWKCIAEYLDKVADSLVKISSSLRND